MDRPVSASFQAVEDWLRSLGLLHYAQSFYDNGYEDIETVKQIDIQDLNAIDIKSDRDREDILNGVKSLNRNIYFELESSQTDKFVERKKLDPVVLKTRVKECLTKHKIQLTEPPYFNPDGSLGDLYPLAIKLADELETIFDDVLEALELLRKRQLPTPSYDAMTEIEKKNGKARTLTTLSVDDLDAQSTAKSRSLSFSKHDTRATKSTTDLTKDFIHKPKEDSASSFKRSDKKSMFGSVFSKKRNDFSKSLKHDQYPQPSWEFHAADSKLSDKEIIEMFSSLKNKQLSQEELLEMARKKSKKELHHRHSMSPQTSPRFSSRDKEKVTRKASATFYTKDSAIQDVKGTESDEGGDQNNENRDDDSDSGTRISKASPEAQKPTGFLKVLRSSLKKKEKIPEEELSRKDTPVEVDQQVCEEVIGTPKDGSQENNQDKQNSSRSSDQISNSPCSLPLPSTLRDSQLQNQIYKDSNSSEYVEEEGKNLGYQANLQDREKDVSSKGSTPKSVPIPPPRSRDSSKPKPVVTAKKPPTIPPRKDLSPGATNGIADIDKDIEHMQQLYMSLSDEVKSLSETKGIAVSGIKKPLVPQKRIIPKVPPVSKSSTSTNTTENKDSAFPRYPQAEGVTKVLDTNMNIQNYVSTVTDYQSNTALKQELQKNKKWKKRPLKQLVMIKLKREGIVLHKEPYTKKDGTWNIPHLMITRYSEELCQSTAEIEQIFEDIRVSECQNDGLSYVKMDFSKWNRKEKQEFLSISLDDWLFQIGLPMFIDDLRIAEINSIDQISSLCSKDFLYIGVYEEKHVNLLLDKVKHFRSMFSNRSDL